MTPELPRDRQLRGPHVALSLGGLNGLDEAIPIMPDDEQGASGPTDRELLLQTRDLLIGLFEATAALALRLTGERMIVAIGDPSGRRWERIKGSRAAVEWEPDSPSDLDVRGRRTVAAPD